MRAAHRSLRDDVELEKRVQAPDVATMRLWLGMNGGFFLTWLGRFDDAIAHLARYDQPVETLPNPHLGLYLHFIQALALGGKGEYERALAILVDVVARCERLGEHFFQGRMMNTLGWIYGELQDFDRAIEWNRRSLQAARGYSTPGPDVLGNALAN